MAEEKEQESTYLEKSGDALLPPISNGQLDHAQVRDLLDDTRSSSLSELEDGTDEVEMASANPVLARQLEADSEAETERLEISPHKNQIHNDIETETLPFTHSPSKLVESTVPQVPDNVPYSDSVVSSPGPSDEELENEMRPERSATSDDGDNNDEGVPDGSPRKRKHTDIEDDSSSNDEDETRRRRRRTQSVRSDVEEESELGLSREPTVEPLLDMPEGQDGLEGTSRTITNTPNILKPKASKAAKATHSKGKAPEILNNILEEGEDAEKPTQQVADEARPESDDEERAEGEDEDVEAVARDEEECMFICFRVLTYANDLQMQRKWRRWSLWLL